MYNTRKVLCKKVQVIATVRAAISELRKRRCNERKSITLHGKSLPVATETGVVANYCLIGSVIIRIQLRKMLACKVNYLSLKM